MCWICTSVNGSCNTLWGWSHSCSWFIHPLHLATHFSLYKENRIQQGIHPLHLATHFSLYKENRIQEGIHPLHLATHFSLYKENRIQQGIHPLHLATHFSLYKENRIQEGIHPLHLATHFSLCKENHIQQDKPLRLYFCRYSSITTAHMCQVQLHLKERRKDFWSGPAVINTCVIFKYSYI